MNKHIIDVLEPYPGEILYSWLSRMFWWYGYSKNSQTNIRNFNNDLFGKSAKTVTNVIVPFNLDNLIKRISLPNSTIFNSVESLIQRTTILPFYMTFIDESEKMKILDYLKINIPSRITKAVLGLNINTYSITDFKFKFCFKCWEENNFCFYNIEHQILNNNICYKHHTRLQFIESNSNEFYRFVNKNIYQYFYYPYCIDQSESLELNIEVSAMIHEIFLNGFKDNITTLKSKLRKKMKDLGYMNAKFNYLENNEEFFLNFEKYNISNIKSEELIYALFNTVIKPNPIIYLTLILFMFGSLESYYDYFLKDCEIKNLKHNAYKAITKIKPKVKGSGLEYFDDAIQNRKDDDYVLLERINKAHYKIKHNSCGHTWIIKQERIHIKDVILCPKCRNKEKENEIKKLRDSIVKGISQEYDYIGSYMNYWELEHKTCGYIFKCSPHIFKEGKRCNKCKKENFRKEKIKEFNDLFNGEYTLIKFKNTQVNSYVLHNDPNCLSQFPILLKHFYNLKKCPICKKAKPYVHK